MKGFATRIGKLVARVVGGGLLDARQGDAPGLRRRRSNVLAAVLAGLPVLMVVASSLGVVATYEIPDWSDDTQRVMAVLFLMLGGAGLFLEIEMQWRRLREARIEGDRLLRHRRHDYANHLQVLSGWAQLGDLARLRSYVKSVSSDVAQESALCRNLPDLAAAELTKLRMAVRTGGGRFSLRVREAEELTGDERHSILAGLTALNGFFGGLTAYPTSDWTLELTAGGTPEGCPALGTGCPTPHCFCARLTGWQGTDPTTAQEVAAGHRGSQRGGPLDRKILRREDGRDVLVFPLGPHAGGAAVSPLVKG